MILLEGAFFHMIYWLSWLSNRLEMDGLGHTLRENYFCYLSHLTSFFDRFLSLSRSLDLGSNVKNSGSRIVDAGTSSQDPRSWILDSASRILLMQDPRSGFVDLGSWMQDSGSLLLDPGYWMLDPGYPGSRIHEPGFGIRIQDPRSRIQSPESRTCLGPASRMPDPRCWILDPATWIDDMKSVRQCSSNKPDNVWTNPTTWWWHQVIHSVVDNSSITIPQNGRYMGNMSFGLCFDYPC